MHMKKAHTYAREAHARAFLVLCIAYWPKAKFAVYRFDNGRWGIRVLDPTGMDPVSAFVPTMGSMQKAEASHRAGIIYRR
jgi:hypothetical protein